MVVSGQPSSGGVWTTFEVLVALVSFGELWEGSVSRDVVVPGADTLEVLVASFGAVRSGEPWRSLVRRGAVWFGGSSCGKAWSGQLSLFIVAPFGAAC